MRARLATALVSLGCTLLSATLARGEPKVEEQVIGPIAQDAKYVVSPRGAHLATATRKGSRQVVIVDGAEGPRFDEILMVAPYVDPRTVWGDLSVRPQPVVFSADGNRHAYAARAGAECVVMADGKEVLRIPQENMREMRLAFTGDTGKHLMFARTDNVNGFELWVDGQKAPGFFRTGGGGTEGTIDPIISPDGERYAYMAQIDREKRSVIVDGKDAGYWADNLQFSADGKRLIGIARGNTEQQVLVDGKPVFAAQNIRAVHPAPAGERIMVVAHAQDPQTGAQSSFLAIDGQRVAAAAAQNIPEVVWSPDGKRYAALCALAPNAQFVVTDGKKGQQYDTIQEKSIKFSADSSKLGYVATANNKFFVVIDEQESDEAFEPIPEYRFSPDGKHVAYSGMVKTSSGSGQLRPVVVDGKVDQPVTPVAAFSSFVFSPDGSRYAYVGAVPAGIFLNGKPSDFGGQDFRFSPDGNHFLVIGTKAPDNQLGMFLDGKLVYGAKTNYGVRHHAFTPDGNHLFWMGQEPPEQPGPPQSVIYLDGKPLARFPFAHVIAQLDPNRMQRMTPDGKMMMDDRPAPAWQVAPDGVLRFIGPVGEEIKRFTITPSADTSVATMLAAEKP